MIFLLIQISFSKQIFDFIKNDPLNLLLYLDDYQVVEILLRERYGAFFSSLNKYSDLSIEVYTDFPNFKDPVQIFDSDNGLVGIAFSNKNISIRISNEGSHMYKIYIMMTMEVPVKGFVPKGFSFPIFKIAENLESKNFSKLNEPFIFSSDSSNKWCKVVIGVMEGVLVTFVLTYIGVLWPCFSL